MNFSQRTEGLPRYVVEDYEEMRAHSTAELMGHLMEVLEAVKNRLYREEPARPLGVGWSARSSLMC